MTRTVTLCWTVPETTSTDSKGVEKVLPARTFYSSREAYDHARSNDIPFGKVRIGTAVG